MSIRMHLGRIAGVGLLLVTGAAAAQQAPAADPAWGIYAKLEGQSMQAVGGSRLLWQREGDTLYEHWIDPVSGKIQASLPITRDAASGQLRLAGRAIAKHTWNGVISADGSSVAWTLPGKSSPDFSVRLNADGSFDYINKRSTTHYLPADGAGVNADEEVAPVDPRAWGVYARLAGTTMQGQQGLSYRWYWRDPATLVEDRGEVWGKSFMSADGAGGLSMTSEDGRDRRTGRVLADGAVLWTLKSRPYRVSIVPEGVDYDHVQLKGGEISDSWNMMHLKGKLPDTR